MGVDVYIAAKHDVRDGKSNIILHSFLVIIINYGFAVFLYTYFEQIQRFLKYYKTVYVQIHLYSANQY